MSANAFVIHNDMSDLCRVCLQLPEKSQYLDLTTIYDEEENLTYGECFTICTQIDLSAGEGLPHYLCKQCGLELQMSYDFHKKIEDSKRIIEQYQMQMKVQNANISESTVISRQPKNLDINENDKANTLDLIEEKYVISGGQFTAQLKGTEEDCLMQEENENTFLNEETDETENLNNMCNIDIKVEHQVTSHESNSSVMGDMNENDEDHLGLDDYQNVEALEEEKIKKFPTDITVKNEILNEELQINGKDEFNATATAQSEYKSVQTIMNENFVEIKCEFFNTLIDNSLQHIDEKDNPLEDVKTADEIKFESDAINKCITPSSAKKQQKLQPPGLPFECEFCGHKLPTKNAVYKHFERKHKHERQSQRRSILKPVICSFCSRAFANEDSLRLHMEKKHSKKRLICEYCGHSSCTKNALAQHCLRKHSDVKKNNKNLHKCLVCSESFITVKILNLHNKNTHFTKKSNKTAEKTWFPCDECGHKLPTKNALSQHRLRKHRGKKVVKKSHRCMYCEMAFLSHKRLQSHLLESHESLPALIEMVQRL